MTRPRTRTGLVIGLPALAAVLLSGCGAGLEAQTYKPRAQGSSTGITVDDLAIRHVSVAAPDSDAGYAKGDDADVTITVVSEKATDDELVSASSPLADSVEVDAPSAGFLIPAFGISDENDGLTLKGLKQVVPAASFVPITVVFKSGTTASVNVPVGVDSKPPDPNPSFHVPDTDSRGNIVQESETPQP